MVGSRFLLSLTASSQNHRTCFHLVESVLEQREGVCVVVLCVGFLVRTSSLADTAEPGVLANEPGDVAGPTAEPGESPSPATSWIS